MTAGDALQDEAGVLLLAADGSIVMSDVAGERWLAQLGTGGSGARVPQVLAAVASRAPVIADAHELTERERAVTRLVARGLGTGSIAERLHISPWTVPDHLTSIFEKIGVSTRGELVARVFLADRGTAGGAQACGITGTMANA